jgi:hypothetical protein
MSRGHVCAPSPHEASGGADLDAVGEARDGLGLQRLGSPRRDHVAYAEARGGSASNSAGCAEGYALVEAGDQPSGTHAPPVHPGSSMQPSDVPQNREHVFCQVAIVVCIGCRDGQRLGMRDDLCVVCMR